MSRLGAPVTLLLAALVVAACGGPAATGPDPDVPQPGAAPGSECRPALTDDDPHPILDGGGGQHPDLAGDWYVPLAEAMDRQYADVTGGLWLDQAAGEVVIMLPMDAPASTMDELRALVDHPDRVVCMDADYTEAELVEWLHVAMSLGSGPMSGGVDTVLNRIEVEAEVDAEQLRDALAAELDDRALAAIEVEMPACARIGEIPDGAAALPGGGSTCGGMDALFEGTLVGDDSCAWFEDDGGETIAVAWPRGWWLDGGVVHDHHGQPMAAIGDEVSGGGGFVPNVEDSCGPATDGAWLVASLSARD